MLASDSMWHDVAISWAVQACAATPYTCGFTATPNTENEIGSTVSDTQIRKGNSGVRARHSSQASYS